MIIVFSCLYILNLKKLDYIMAVKRAIKTTCPCPILLLRNTCSGDISYIHIFTSVQRSSMDQYWPFVVVVVSIISWKPLQARKAWEYRLSRSLSSNLRSYMTSRSFGGHHGLRGHQNGNIHIHTRVIEVADIKSDVKIGLLTIAARSSIGPLPSCFRTPRSGGRAR